MGPLGTPRFFTPVPISLMFLARFSSLIIQMSDVSICQSARCPSIRSTVFLPAGHPGDSLVRLAASRAERQTRGSALFSLFRFRQAPISAIKRPRKAAKTGRTLSSALFCIPPLRVVRPARILEARAGPRCYLAVHTYDCAYTRYLDRALICMPR